MPHQNGNHASPRDVRSSDLHEPSTRVTLQSWKEIASELNRGVRTVQRWEETLGLPIRRIGTGRRCPVFAFRDELHLWLRENTKALGARDPKDGNHETRLQTSPKPAAALLELINDFFEHSTTAKQTCDRCDSAMKHFEACFWIPETSKKWRMSVPFCPVCDAACLEEIRRAHRVQ
jgi:hypothetical protein